MRFVARLVAAALVAIAVTPVLASPARACSCVSPTDIQGWVDESEAAFVGTLIEKRDAGPAGQFGPESIYVFEVEKWVKGNAGDVIEVRSASDGAACGFEFWTPDQRTGAFIREENGVLRGDLCSQVEPEVLLAATTAPTPSSTGIGHLLIGGDWTSSHLTVVDSQGHLVIGIDPPDVDPGMGGATNLDVCPGGDLVVQSTSGNVVVWDLAGYEPVAAYPIPGGWISDISCRNDDASSIWVIASNDVTSDLIEVVSEPTEILALPGPVGRIGSDFVLVQEEHEGDAIWVDIETGATRELTETPPQELRSVSIASHPTERLAAVVETRFVVNGPVTATLTVFDGSGAVVEAFDIPWETYSPTWLDGHRIAVKAYDFNDWERALGIVYDLEDGEVVEVEGWNMEHIVADGTILYGVSGGSVMTTSLTNPQVEKLVTLPLQSVGPLVLLDGVPAVTSTPTVPVETGATTPPLVASVQVVEIGGTGHLQWLAGAVMVLFFGLLAWLARRPSAVDSGRRGGDRDPGAV